MGKHSASQPQRQGRAAARGGQAGRQGARSGAPNGAPRPPAPPPQTRRDKQAAQVAARSQDSNLRGMARGGSLNLVGAVIQQGALFTVMVVLGNGLGKADVGRYAICWSLLALMGLLSLAGFRAGLTRFIAVYLAENDPSRVRGTIRLGLCVTVMGSTLIAAALTMAASSIANFYHEPGLVPAIHLTAAALPATAFSDAALAATQGWRSQRAYAVIGRIIDPLTLLGLTGLAVLVGYGLEGALWAVVIGAWSTAALAATALGRSVRTLPKVPPRMEPRAIFSFSMVSWLSSLAATGLIWTGTLILGRLTDPNSTGVFTVAARLVNLAVFVMAPITTTFSPVLARLVHLEQFTEGARAYGNATRWILFASAPAFVMLIVMPEQMLTVFGKEFHTGAHVTMILAVGQLVAAAAGPCGIVLNMSGRVWMSLVDNVLALVINIVLCLVLIPPLGIIGAAIAWSTALITVNLVKLLQARFLVGISPTGATTWQILASAVPAAAAAWVVRETISIPLLAVLIGGVAVVVVYVAARVTLGLHEDDRALLLRLPPRVRRRLSRFVRLV